jgi:hypothetical protein
VHDADQIGCRKSIQREYCLFAADFDYEEKHREARLVVRHEFHEKCMAQLRNRRQQAPDDPGKRPIVRHVGSRVCLHSLFPRLL